MRSKKSLYVVFYQRRATTSGYTIVINPYLQIVMYYYLISSSNLLLVNHVILTTLYHVSIVSSLNRPLTSEEYSRMGHSIAEASGYRIIYRFIG